jgi:putative transposase
LAEAALAADLTFHLGPARGNTAEGNVRNGATPRTLRTDLGPVELHTPRHRDGTFEPQLVAKGPAGRPGRRILDM